MICPKCQHEQDDSNHECVKCGIIFEKYHAYQQSLQSSQSPPRATSYANIHEEKESILSTINEILFHVPDKVNVVVFWVRVVLLVGLFIWGWKFILASIESNASGNSFMHLVNLPFHEAGHLIFSPFGKIIRSLGGTLGQILMPIICLVVLLIKTRDAFGASVVLWWVGENFIDIALFSVVIN